MFVDDLLAEAELGLDVRVRGDARRPIRWVHTIEVPDPGRFLRGGEVVLTAGVWRSAGVTAEQFVGDLAAAGVAAVGFGIVPPETEVPEDFVAAARSRGLTCFVVPPAVAFLQVVDAFVAAKRGEWERPLRRHLDQHEAIVAALRAQRGAATVLRVLTRQLRLPVALRAGGEIVGRQPPEPCCPVALVGEGIADAEILLPHRLEDLGVEQHAAVVQAMPFMALELERERAVRATDLRYAWELFEWVQTGTAGTGALRTRLRSLGLPPDGPLAGVVLRTASPAADAARLARLLGDDGVAVERDGEVVALTRLEGDVAEWAWHRHAELTGGDRASGGVGLGVGKPGAPSELRLSLLQAGHAAEAAATRSGRGWMTHEQLSSPSLLLSVQDPELLAATSHALLGSVLEHDERRGGELLPSLAAFLDASGRWQEAAGRLHVHINTLRHRISRVEELTGRSLASTPDRVDLFLALRALRQR